MELIKKINRDILYKIDLRMIEGCMEYCLVNANNSEEVYMILNDEEINNGR